MTSTPDELNAPIRTVEEAMIRVYPAATASPCNECPWRRVAPTREFVEHHNGT